MDTAVVIWIIIGIIVVAIIVIAVLAFTARGRTARRREAEHDKAEKLRADARESELAAREGEARAAQVRADAASAAAASQQAQAQAAQADVEARRLADSVDEHDVEAAKHRAEQEETLRKADEVDPYVTADADTRDTDAAAAGNAAAADVRYDRVDGERYSAAGTADDAAATRDEPSITRPPVRTAETEQVAQTHDDPVIDDAPPTRRGGAEPV